MKTLSPAKFNQIISSQISIVDPMMDSTIIDLITIGTTIASTTASSTWQIVIG